MALKNTMTNMTDGGGSGKHQNTGAKFIPTSALQGMANAKTAEQIQKEKEEALAAKNAGKSGGGGVSYSSSSSSSPAVGRTAR